mgnify:CR=1 FL=1
MNDTSPPLDGYTIYDPIDPYENHAGPFFWKEENGVQKFALQAEARHCNRHEIVHGGLMMTMIDLAMVVAAKETWEEQLVTVSLNSEFIDAVRMQGASPARIIFRHILPLCTSSMIIRVTLDMAGIILTAAGLGFIGLGAQPPLPEWGAMISRGRAFILDQWWVATMPGFAILVVSLGFCFLGDGLRDVLDPKQGAGR